jgi:Uma2 family endonuclease
MAANAQPRLTPQEYLARERAAEFRSEFFDGGIYAMAGGSAQHALLVANLVREIGNALRASPCVVVSQDLRTSVSADGLYTYPDVLVVCGEMRFLDDQRDTLTNPKLIVEVLSPGTEAYDRGLKFAQYRTIESLDEYALVSQAEARVEVYRRRENREWLYADYAGHEATALFETVGSIPLSEIYSKVTLDRPLTPPR